MSERGAKPQRCRFVTLPEVVALIRFVRSCTVALAAAALVAAGAAGPRPALAAAPPPAPAVTAGGPAGIQATPGPGGGANAAAPVAAPAGAPTPIPVIAAPTDPPAPGATATAQPGRHRGRKPSASASPGAATPEPTPTPTVPGFATLDGTWEVQVQHPDSTEYSYLTIKQTGTALSGSWKVKKQAYPFQDADCTYDGKLVRIVTKTATGTATFSGYVENGTDMVGTLDLGDKADPTPFTAGHRGKDKGLFGPGISPAGLPLPGSGGAGSNFPH